MSHPFSILRRVAAGLAVLMSLAASAHAAPAPATPAKAAPIDIAKAEQLAQANACVSCHTAKRRLVGPSYEAVAAKYKGDANAEAKLMAKIKNGGAGVWGMIPMPAHPRISEADNRLLTQWVLQGAPTK